MYIPALNQKLIILGLDEVQRLPNAFLADWNILSITARMNRVPLYFPAAQKMCRLSFDDVEEDEPAAGSFAAREEDVEKAILFSREIGTEPLLIHCFAGISRSTAIAWIIVWDKLRAKADSVRQSFGIVRDARPMLMPNRHILRLGIKALAPMGTRSLITQQFQDCLDELDCFDPDSYA